MFYRLIKIFIRLALRIFCRKTEIKGRDFLDVTGPVLITANHPNSFFDAIVIGSRFRRPVHFLARGDAFRKPWHGKLLRLLNMIPIYRMRDGKENLLLNENAFKQSGQILQQGGIVLIFIEGICVNQHSLQPFKKGAARIASENKTLPGFTVLPVSIAYHSLHRFGKRINMNLAPPISAATLFIYEEEAKNTRHFNEVLLGEIENNISIPPAQQMICKAKKAILFLPAVAGFGLHIALYTLIKHAVKNKTTGTVFYDSVLFGVLLVLYPVFLLTIFLLLLILKTPIVLALSIFLIFPLLARCAIEFRQ